jgi:predicted nucleic acid-binding protein
MSDKFFVDTNILMYAHDTAAGERHTRARALVEELWEGRSGVVSAQVEILYSEDLSDGQRYGSVRVRNPFGTSG